MPLVHKKFFSFLLLGSLGNVAHINESNFPGVFISQGLAFMKPLAIMKSNWRDRKDITFLIIFIL